MLTPSRQLAGFIAKFDPAVAKVIRACRAAMRKEFPTANELVYDNYNFFVIGYASTDRASDGIVSIAAAANGVSLCFIYGAKLPDPDKRMHGGGSQVRFVKLPSAATLKEPAVKRLLKAAAGHAKHPLPKTGKGRLIIKSISAKQRPRRRAAT
jgi:hypothetical protein